MKRMIVLGLVLFTSLASAACAQQRMARKMPTGKPEITTRLTRSVSISVESLTRSATGTVIHPLRVCPAGGQRREHG